MDLEDDSLKSFASLQPSTTLCASGLDLHERLRQQYKAQRDRIEGHQLLELNALHRRQEDELFRFHNDKQCATPVSDEVGIILGQLSELALERKLPRLTQLVEGLVEALDSQLTGFYRHMRGDAALVQSAPPVRPFEADAALVEMQRQASAREEDPLLQPPHVEPRGSKQRRERRATSTAAAASQPAAARSASRSDASEVTRAFSTTTFLMAEALATTLHAEQVRIFALDSSGNALQLAACFPPRSRDAGDVGMASADQLHRALQSAVFNKAMAVAGHDAQPFASPGASAAPAVAEATGSGSSPPPTRTCLVWPIVQHAPRPNQPRALGVIEVRNKVSQSTEGARQFSDMDEAVVHVASRLLEAVMNRYDSRLFSCNVGAEVAAAARPHCATLPHLPPQMQLGVPSAERVVGRCLERAEPLLIYRAPVATIHRPGGATSRSEVFTSASSATADIGSVEFAIDSLHEMWRTAYRENAAMHSQCRRWATQVKELTVITRAFQDALVAARGLRTVEDVHLYMRALELSLKSGDSGTVTGLIDQVATTADSSSPVKVAGGPPAQSSRRGNPLADMYVDGPSDVRTYTVDPESRREQLRAIDAALASATERTEGQCGSSPPQRFHRLTDSARARQQQQQQQRRRRGLVRPSLSAATSQTPFRLQYKPAPPRGSSETHMPPIHPPSPR